MSTPNSGNPTNLSALSAKRMENGGEFAGILQPEHQFALITDATVASGANPTKAEYDGLVAKFNALLDGMAAVGLMKSA